MIEQMYKPDEAGKILKLHARDVRRLIRDGQLRAKCRNMRGTVGKQGGKPKPHYLIPESALADYLSALPDAVSSDEPSTVKRLPRAKQNHSGHLSGVKQWV